MKIFFIVAVALAVVAMVAADEGENKADENKAGDNKADENKAGDNKADENKAGENEAGESKAGENKAGDNKADENKAGENKAGENKAGENEAGENEAGENKADENKGKMTCFKDCKVSKADLQNCMEENKEKTEAGPKTYKCMFKLLGAKKNYTGREILDLLKPCAVDEGALETKVKDCIDKKGLAKVAKCFNSKLDKVCNDDDPSETPKSE